MISSIDRHAHTNALAFAIAFACLDGEVAYGYFVSKPNDDPRDLTLLLILILNFEYFLSAMHYCYYYMDMARRNRSTDVSHSYIFKFTFAIEGTIQNLNYEFKYYILYIYAARLFFVFIFDYKTQYLRFYI
jgi:hypothetical protein